MYLKDFFVVEFSNSALKHLYNRLLNGAQILTKRAA